MFSVALPMYPTWSCPPVFVQREPLPSTFTVPREPNWSPMIPSAPETVCVTNPPLVMFNVATALPNSPTRKLPACVQREPAPSTTASATLFAPTVANESDTVPPPVIEIVPGAFPATSIQLVLIHDDPGPLTATAPAPSRPMLVMLPVMRSAPLLTRSVPLRVEPTARRLENRSVPPVVTATVPLPPPPMSPIRPISPPTAEAVPSAIVRRPAAPMPRRASPTISDVLPVLLSVYVAALRSKVTSPSDTSRREFVRLPMNETVYVPLRSKIARSAALGTPIGSQLVVVWKNPPLPLTQSRSTASAGADRPQRRTANAMAIVSVRRDIWRISLPGPRGSG